MCTIREQQGIPGSKVAKVSGFPLGKISKQPKSPWQKLIRTLGAATRPANCTLNCTQNSVCIGVKGSDSITGKFRKVTYINASNCDCDEIDLAMASKQEVFAAKLACAKAVLMLRLRQSPWWLGTHLLH